MCLKVCSIAYSELKFNNKDSMFSRGKPLSTSASASMLPNNLAVNLNATTGTADILFLHKSAVQMMLSSEETGDGRLERSVVCKIPSINQQVSYVLIMQVRMSCILSLFSLSFSFIYILL